MRLPTARDLTEEQEEVYLYAPTDGRVLVSGPPGTGKTVLALLRAAELARKGRRVAVAMFNRMLEAYTSNRPPRQPGKITEKVEIRTVRYLFRDLWFRLRLPPHPSASVVLLDTPYSEREHAKALGARWKPQSKLWLPGRLRGAWTIGSDLYHSDPVRFERWKPTSDLPVTDDSEFSIDWDEATGHLLHHGSKANWMELRFDDLIVDEAQDFPPAFFRFLHLLSEGVFGNTERTSSILVLADENQRLRLTKNSTIADIEQALRIPAERHYRLMTNFRNTREIAIVSRHFFAGMRTGLPELPERRGPMPVLRRCSDIRAVRALILRHAANNPGHEIGVVVPDDDQARSRYFNEVKSNADHIRVQTYAFNDPVYNNPKGQLAFDEPGITVLNRASCKGLEFDAVFVVHLEQARIGGDQSISSGWACM